MKDAYSFHRSFTDLNNFFPKIFAAYTKIFKRCHVEVITAEAGVGYIGGEKAYEFLLPVDYGDDVVIVCDHCGYSANRVVAVGKKEVVNEVPRELEVVHTPNCTTMDDLSTCLDIPKEKLGKAMVFKTTVGYVMATVRGDYDVSLEKLSRYLGIPVLRKASKQELELLGLIPGYLSPIELSQEVDVVLDDTIANSSNLVFGTNQINYHYINVNFGRDYEGENVGDISMIKAENFCIQCGHPLREVQAMELGNIFKLGTFFTKGMKLACTDEHGNKFYPSMGAYGIGLGRLMTAIVEENRDNKGICWPYNIAPYKVFLMGIGKSFRVQKLVDKLQSEFFEELLEDDRPESPGVKFKDADLIGLPLRIVISSKNLQDNKVEFHDRKTGETWLVSVGKISEVLEEQRNL
jgi:prolyl-tRNA synthetase